MLHRIGVVIELRRLDQADLGIDELADDAFKDGALRRKVGIEDQDEGGVGDLLRPADRIVDIAALGALVIVARQVADTELGAVIAQPLTAAVVEDPDGEVAVVDRLGGKDGPLQDADVLIIGADEDVDGRRLAHRRDHRLAGIRSAGMIGAAEEEDDRQQRIDDHHRLEGEVDARP